MNKKPQTDEADVSLVLDLDTLRTFPEAGWRILRAIEETLTVLREIADEARVKGEWAKHDKAVADAAAVARLHVLKQLPPP